jgi:L-lactate dehydrogenase complex protein LldF
MNAGNNKLKNWVVNNFIKGWKKHHGEMEFPKKSFNQMWKEMNNIR